MSTYFKQIERSTLLPDGLETICVKSKCLNARVDLTVYLPKEAIGINNLPVVILLHGVYGSHWSWALNGSAHTSLQQGIENGTFLPMLLVMPSDGLWGDGSGYINHSGKDFEQWVAKEVPLLVKKLYPEVGTESHFYIAGLSMGAYGALRIGSKYKDIFKGISGHSCITAADQLNIFVEEKIPLEQLDPQEIALENHLIKYKNQLPPLRFDCGLKDPLYHFNKKLHSLLEKENIAHQFEVLAGKHDWAYWKENVNKSFDFFSKIEKGLTKIP